MGHGTLVARIEKSATGVTVAENVEGLGLRATRLLRTAVDVDASG